MNFFEKIKNFYSQESENQKQIKETIEEPATVEEFESDNAKYHLVRSIHIIPNRIEEIGNPDIAVLETGTAHYRKDPKEIIQAFEKHQIQYEDVINKLKETETPIYFVDVPFKAGSVGEEIVEELPSIFNIDRPSHEKSPVLKHPMKKALLGALSTYLVFKSEKGNLDKSISRREFLKSMGKTAGALLLMSPLANPLYDLLDDSLNPEKKIKRETKKEYQEIIDELILTFRNAVIAEKTEHLAKTLKDNKKGAKPDITIFMGAAHFSGKDPMSLNNLLMLKQTPERNRVKIINKFLEKPNFSKYIVDPKEITRVSSVRFSKDKNDWEVETNYDDYLLGGGRG